jgi:hypothetical protein
MELQDLAREDVWREGGRSEDEYRVQVTINYRNELLLHNIPAAPA